MSATMPMGKPLCGGGKPPTQYDLPLHIVAVFMVLGASILGAGFPVVAKRVSWVKVPTKVFFACKHFGTGVLVATAFVHLLPTAFGSLSNPCLPDLFIKDYPALPGVIMMGAMFLLFIVEMWLNAKMGPGGHSHGGTFTEGTTIGGGLTTPTSVTRVDPRTYPTDDVPSEKKMADMGLGGLSSNPFTDANGQFTPPSEMPPWFIVFYEQYIRQRLELINMIKAAAPAVARRSIIASGNSLPGAHQLEAKPREDWFIDYEGNWTDPEVYKRANLNISLLEGGILFHSVFVGITISLTTDGFIVLLIAIMFHQMFEGLGLGSRIASVPYPKGSIRPWVLVVAFGTTCPIGQAIGLATRGTYDPESALGLIMVGVFNAISSGLLIWAALVDLLAEDFLSVESQLHMTSGQRKLAFFFVILGAIGMSVVGAFA